MPRLFAFLAAILFSTLAVTSACTAAEGASEPLAFTLQPARQDSRIHAEFGKGRHDNQWSSDFAASDLAGLDLSLLRSSASGPIRFALVREAGRLDCAGSGGNRMARGTCRFTPDAAFVSYLTTRGIARPDDDQAFALMAVGVGRDILDSLTAAHYPVPELDDLIALTAVGVSGDYIAGLSRAGYRPDDLDTLLQFKALGITPEWIAGFVRMGYARLPADELVQLKALGITPEFVAGFERVGYGRLPADDLVQLKALGITPEFASRMRRNGQLPSANRLVELRVGADILGRN